MNRVLNVGGGHKSILPPKIYAGWDQVMLDIDPASEADVICDARALAGREEYQGQFDAILCSHNLEHYFVHDIPRVLDGFKHAMKDDGFVHIAVPNIQGMMRRVVENGLDIEDVMYVSPAGPIRALDMIYGHAGMIASHQNDFMCHKTGFSPKSLGNLLLHAGFNHVYIGTPDFDIQAFAFKQPPTDAQRALLGLKESQTESSGAVDKAASDLLPAQPEAVPAGLEVEVV